MTFDTEFTNNIVCPHCGDENGDSWELAMKDGEHEIQDCGSCNEQFEVYCDISISYSTEKLKPKGE